MRPRLRFEVLKRDKFLCRYCGEGSPDVLLQVDHILPVSAGGTDDLDNLTTACIACNQGKKASLLQEDRTMPVPPSVLLDAAYAHLTMAMDAASDAKSEVLKTLRALGPLAPESLHNASTILNHAYVCCVEALFTQYPDWANADHPIDGGGSQ